MCAAQPKLGTDNAERSLAKLCKRSQIREVEHPRQRDCQDAAQVTEALSRSGEELSIFIRALARQALRQSPRLCVRIFLDLSWHGKFTQGWRRLGKAALHCNFFESHFDLTNARIFNTIAGWIASGSVAGVLGDDHHDAPKFFRSCFGKIILLLQLARKHGVPHGLVSSASLITGCIKTKQLSGHGFCNIPVCVFGSRSCKQISCVTWPLPMVEDMMPCSTRVCRFSCKVHRSIQRPHLVIVPRLCQLLVEAGTRKDAVARWQVFAY